MQGHTLSGSKTQEVNIIGEEGLGGDEHTPTLFLSYNKSTFHHIYVTIITTLWKEHDQCRLTMLSIMRSSADEIMQQVARSN